MFGSVMAGTGFKTTVNRKSMFGSNIANRVRNAYSGPSQIDRVQHGLIGSAIVDGKKTCGGDTVHRSPSSFFYKYRFPPIFFGGYRLPAFTFIKHNSPRCIHTIRMHVMVHDSGTVKLLTQGSLTLRRFTLLTLHTRSECILKQSRKIRYP